jgi:enoyl-[acyl-carrier protein] reductase I
METPWSDVSTAVEVSAYSLKAITTACLPVLNNPSSVVGLTFDATVSWPVYDWMGVAKAAFESTARYLARYLGDKGIRVNLISAGPLRTTAAKGIPGFATMEELWTGRAPLGWDLTDTEAAAKGLVALLSDWFPATTGELIHVDGGLHSTGA